MNTATNKSTLFQNKAFFNLSYQIKREIPVLKITESQLPLIFKQLKVGSEVILKQVVAEGKVWVTVYYQGFRLGWLPQDVSNQILAEISEGRIYRAVVTRLTKKPFLPPSQVFVNILSPNEPIGGQTCLSFEM